MVEGVFDIDVINDGGVKKRILTPGQGDETPGLKDTVEVHYTGKLTNGDVFDSSLSRNQPFTFVLGKGEVIKGWDLAVAGMTKGEKSEFLITPCYAYGDHGSPPKIGPNQTLIFEIELLDWHMQDASPDKSKSILMKTIKIEHGYDRPRNGTVVINLTCRLDSGTGKIFDQRENVTFNMGEGSEQHLMRAVEHAVRKMRQGEVAKVFVKSTKYGYDDVYQKPEGVDIPDDWEQVVLEIELIKFENEKEVWQMSPKERLVQAELSKEKGTGYFKQEKYELALLQYQKIVQYIGPPNDRNFESLSEEREKQLLSGYLNLAICYLKLENFDEVLKNANLALTLDSKNPKAFFRRGLAYFSIKEYEKAIEDFNQCLAIEPGNKAAKNQILMCKHQLKQHTEMEKKKYRNLFEVLSKDD